MPRWDVQQEVSRELQRDVGLQWVWFVLFNDTWSQYGHLMSCMTILFINLQISKSDIRPHIKWAISLVILHMVTSIYLWGLCGYVWVNILTLSPQRVAYNGMMNKMIKWDRKFHKSLNGKFHNSFNINGKFQENFDRKFKRNFDGKFNGNMCRKINKNLDGKEGKWRRDMIGR